MEFYFQIIANGLLLGGLYALLAVGLTLIFGVLRVVNFAHAEFMMLGMYGAYWLWALFGFDPYFSALIVIPLIFILGMLVGRLIIERTIGAPDVTVVFATLGLSILLQNLALTVWTADIRSVSTSYSGAVFVLGGIRLGMGMAISFGAALLFAAGLWLFLNRTRYGKAIQAVAQNRNAASLMGIDVRKVYLITYSVAVAAAGAMGVLMAPVFSVFPRVGQSYIVTAFVIVVLAGLGSVPGAVAAALLIGVILTTAAYFIGTAWAELAYFVIFLAVLIARPQGFFGKKGAEVY
jgi:branched-chain amino acid transport system permease protein